MKYTGSSNELENINTVSEMTEWIKASIQAPGSLFDGLKLSDDEILGMAQSSINLSRASMKLEYTPAKAAQSLKEVLGMLDRL